MKKTIKPLSIYFLILVSALIAFGAQAGDLILKDGSQIKGEIVGLNTEKRVVILKNNDRIYTYGFDVVVRYVSKDYQSDEQLVNGVIKNHQTKDKELLHKYGIAVGVSNIDYYQQDSEVNSSDVYASLSGMDISGAYYINNYWSVDGGLYWGKTDKLTWGDDELVLSEWTEFESISAVGARSGTSVGWNLRDKGFRIYTGLGVHAEQARLKRTKGSTIKDNMLGMAVRFGLGWNWRKLSLDFWISSRSNSVYGFDDGSKRSVLALIYRL